MFVESCTGTQVVGGTSTLEHTESGRADGNDSSTACFRARESVDRLGRQIVGFPVHHMFFDLLRLHRRKCSQADMERDIADVDPKVSDALEHFGSEVQTGGGRSNRPGCLRINSLIALEVLRLMIRVGSPNIRGRGISPNFGKFAMMSGVPLNRSRR